MGGRVYLWVRASVSKPSVASIAISSAAAAAMSSLIVRNAATASLGGSRCRTRVGLPRPCLPTPAARTRLSCGDMISACSQPPLMAAKRCGASRSSHLRAHLREL